MTTIEARGAYLFVEYDGPTDPASIIPLMQEMAGRARQENCKKILADLRNAQGSMKLLDRFDLGVLAVDLFRGVTQIAIVAPPDENNSFGEAVAVNRGLPTRITHDMDEAKRWLGVE